LVIGVVPGLGLPNMMTVRGRMSSPAFFGGTIDPAKNDPASSGLRIDRSLKIIDCFLYRVPAWFRDESIVRGPGNGRYRERNRRYESDICHLIVLPCRWIGKNQSSAR
jgi:hypothetical protein